MQKVVNLAAAVPNPIPCMEGGRGPHDPKQ